MRKRIYVYEMDCYKQASEEQIGKMHIRPDRYFDLEGLPTEEISRLLEEFIWDRGKKLAPSSLSSELLYYNNIRDFLIDRNIRTLDAKAEEKIIRMLKGWMMENGYALSSKKYRALYDRIGIETPGIVKHMKKILKFAEEDDDRDEQEKDIWNLKNFDFPIHSNPILNMETINFTKITQPDIREEVKKAVFMHLKYSPLGTIQSEMTAIKRFARFLEKRCPDIKSLQELERLHIEQYLIYLQTEAHERKNYRSDLYALRRVLEDVGNLYERQSLSELFLSNDFPSTPRHLFKFYSDAEIKRLNEHIFKMDEQICRALIIHQLLGTRISDTLTLKPDCLSMREGRYFIRIDQVKSVTYEKAISEEVARLIMKAIDYTKERYGETTYIFVKKNDPTKPYQYSMIQNQIMKMIRQEDIRDDNGELLQFGTHIFRHCYGKKLTEMHVDDWMMLESEKEELPAENNPLADIVDIQAQALLNLVSPEGFTLSSKAVKSEETVSNRKLRQGYGTMKEKDNGAGDTIFFNLYLIDKFGNAANKKKNTVLDYEMEYLLGGKASDKDNLEYVIGRIRILRFAVNYGYLLTDKDMQMEVDTLATTLSAVFLSPEIRPVIKHALLLAWAYGESLTDVKTLLAGKKVPAVKSKESWNLTLDSLLELSKNRSIPEGKETEEGNSYEQYLQMMLVLKSKEELSMRALDLVEMNLRSGMEKTFFRADACVSGADFDMTCYLRRGIRYQYHILYQYQ